MERSNKVRVAPLTKPTKQTIPVSQTKKQKIIISVKENEILSRETLGIKKIRVCHEAFIQVNMKV